MAKILITQELILKQLLPGVHAEIIDASMDEGGAVALEIVGDDVPECEQVTGVVHERYLRMELKPV